jgi:hypothetical protein
MKLLFCIISILLSVACSPKPAKVLENKSNLQNQSVNQPTKPIEEKSLEKLEEISGKLNMPDVINFDVQNLFRNSSQKDESGRNKPPFVDAEVNFSLDQEPNIADKVTIVPLNVDIEPFQLSILKFEKVENAGCDNTKIKRDFIWNVELEKINNKEILEINPIKNNHPKFPFEVFLIYPAVKFAKNLPSEELKPEMLPKGVTNFTVKAAIDLTNDNNPDLLYVEFCCKDKNESLDNCDYNCIQWYKKVNGIWKLFDDAIPC